MQWNIGWIDFPLVKEMCFCLFVYLILNVREAMFFYVAPTMSESSESTISMGLKCVLDENELIQSQLAEASQK